MVSPCHPIHPSGGFRAPPREQAAAKPAPLSASPGHLEPGIEDALDSPVRQEESLTGAALLAGFARHAGGWQAAGATAPSVAAAAGGLGPLGHSAVGSAWIGPQAAGLSATAPDNSNGLRLSAESLRRKAAAAARAQRQAADAYDAKVAEASAAPAGTPRGRLPSQSPSSQAYGTPCGVEESEGSGFIKAVPSPALQADELGVGERPKERVDGAQSSAAMDAAVPASPPPAPKMVPEALLAQAERRAEEAEGQVQRLLGMCRGYEDQIRALRLEADDMETRLRKAETRAGRVADLEWELLEARREALGLGLAQEPAAVRQSKAAGYYVPAGADTGRRSSAYEVDTVHEDAGDAGWLLRAEVGGAQAGDDGRVPASPAGARRAAEKRAGGPPPKVSDAEDMVTGRITSGTTLHGRFVLVLAVLARMFKPTAA